MRRHFTLFVFLCGGCLLTGATLFAQTAEVIYHGGDIVTVDDNNPTAEALAVQGGKILAVGTLEDVLKLQGAATKRVDLKGKTLVPGFLDGHSHFINCLQVSRQANCFAPPAGPGKSIADIIAALKQTQRKYSIPNGEFVVGYGYDGNALSDGREMTAEDLDRAFPDQPVFVQHVSLHGAVCNSAALKKFKVTKDTPTPAGGVILRKPGSMEPAGLLMEAAWMPIFSTLPKPSEAELLKRFQAGQEIYAAAGVTTAQEGATMAADVALLQKAAAQGLLSIDVTAYPFITEAKAVFEKNPPASFGKYSNRFKLGGIKITADGSPQGRTAFFTKPYLTGGPGGEPDWRGEPLFPQAQIDEFVKFVYDSGVQLIIHCNGDAAIDMFLEAHEKVAKDRFADKRTTVIHSQFVRKDQLAKYVEYKIIPSFFTEHCFYFGETHLKNRGKEQTYFLSPMKTALEMGITCANHTDFNVSPIDQMFVLWSAVNRVSRGGEVIGPEERITPLQSLKALTIDAAHMYQEERTKGSLEVGKLADLVILDKNPLKVEPLAIKEIQVLETIKEGKTIYRKGSVRS
ncbi:MAG: amidohydrolase, partial [Planctomycetota bacterium]|nr:amidohydrolase [Planctomycetota bacterium]